MTLPDRIPEPRPVRPTAIARWFVTAAALQWKAFLPLFAVGFVGLTIVSLLGMSKFLAHVALLVTHLVGVAICSCADTRKQIGRNELRACLLKLMPACIVASYHLIGMFFCYFIYDSVSGHAQFEYLFNPTANVEFAIFDFDFAMGSYLVVRIVSSLYPYAFHLHALAGHGLIESAMKGDGGRPAINVFALTALDVTCIALLAVVTVLFTPAAPILMGLFSALSYVSYREIYLGVAENATERNPGGVAVVQH